MGNADTRLDTLAVASMVLAGTTALAGAVRLLGPETWLPRLDGMTLTYFGVAGAMLVLRNVKSLSFGDYKLEMARVEEKASEALAEAKTASSMARLGAIEPADPGTTAAGAADQAAWTRHAGQVADDPWKGVFGGKAEANGRRLRASVQPVANEDGWFRLRIWVESTDPEARPLQDRVRFFLHPTCRNHSPFVPVVGGIAELRLKVWGAFTVAALADDGRTSLELDLAGDRSFPRAFRDR
ncbi:MAG TPA: pYEATS domain-containing protein [Planctomycetota bacterium]|nr:pYEATS domain-containing protein [Planctomycetota bacterium]